MVLVSHLHFAKSAKKKEKQYWPANKREKTKKEINFAAGLEYFALAQLCGFGSVFCVFFFNFQLGCLKNTPYNLQSHIP